MLSSADQLPCLKAQILLPARFVKYLVFNTLFSISTINFTKSSKELIHRFSASLLYLSFYYKVYMLDDASCPMFILRLFNFYMPILALGFWHLGQMVFRSRGNGHGTNQKSKWKGNCQLKACSHSFFFLNNLCVCLRFFFLGGDF